MWTAWLLGALAVCASAPQPAPTTPLIPAGRVRRGNRPAVHRDRLAVRFPHRPAPIPAGQPLEAQRRPNRAVPGAPRWSGGWGLAALAAGPVAVAVAAVAGRRVPPTGGSADTDAGEESALASFGKWARAAGITTPLVEVRSSGGGRGLFATREVRAGQCLVSVPEAATLLVVDGMPTPFPHFVSPEGWAGLPWQARLACRLLYERRQGPASRFAAFLDVLPTRFTRAPRLPAADLRALGYPALERAVAQEHAAVRAVLDHLRATRPAECPEADSIRDEELQWALDCVFSRAFSGEVPPLPSPPLLLRVGAVLAAAVGVVALPALASVGYLFLAGVVAYSLAEWKVSHGGLTGRWYGLFPVMDMVNHHSGTDSHIFFNRFTDRFNLIADQRVLAGQECFLSYGRLSNDDLLLRYGFVEVGNPADVYIFEDLLAGRGDGGGCPLAAILDRRGSLDVMADFALCGACGGDRAATQQALRAAVQRELATAFPAAAAAEAEAEPPRGLGLVCAFRRAKRAVLEDALRALRRPPDPPTPDLQTPDPSG